MDEVDQNTNSLQQTTGEFDVSMDSLGHATGHQGQNLDDPGIPMDDFVGMLDTFQDLEPPKYSRHHHWLHGTIRDTIMSYNLRPEVSFANIRDQLNIRVFLFCDGRLLLFCNPSSMNLTVPMRHYPSDFQLSPGDDHVAYQVIQLLEPLIRQERVAGLQFVDFGFDSPLTEEVPDGRTLNLAVVLQAKKLVLDDAWLQRNMAPFTEYDFIDVEAVTTKFLQCDITLTLLHAAAQRYHSFTADMVEKLDMPMLKSLCLNTLDVFLGLWEMTNNKRTRWAAIGQVGKYPFEGLHIMPLSEEQYVEAVRRGFTHWHHGAWEYVIVGSINQFGVETGEKIGSRMWLHDHSSLAQVFDGEGFMRLRFLKTPQRLRFEKRGDERPLSKDDEGQEWVGGAAASSAIQHAAGSSSATA